MNLFHRRTLGPISTAAGLACALAAQPARQTPPKAAARPVQAQTTSTFSDTPAADGSELVEIRNVSYEVTSTQVPGRPPNERLLLRNTMHSKQTLGDIGTEATLTLEAWRLGDDPKQKPLYAVTVTGTDGHTLDNSLLVASRGLEETQWWSIYKLGTGQHLFDTYLPLLGFSISRDTVTERYVGLQIPPGDETDARLRKPNVVGVLTYSSEDRVIREALLTCDDPKRAALLRSYADVTRTVALVEGPSRALKLVFSENYPSPANTMALLIPIAGDDLDLAHAQLPPRLHAVAWKR
jgi:hypothetical protein